MAMDALVQELSQAVADHILPIFKDHGLGEPHTLIEEREGGPDDGGYVVMHCTSLDPSEGPEAVLEEAASDGSSEADRLAEVAFGPVINALVGEVDPDTGTMYTWEGIARAAAQVGRALANILAGRSAEDDGDDDDDANKQEQT